ncbi:MAG TPA: hypothetical protein VG222_06940 [Vicinamibacterales bacterium]|nr:hypothetical protein [Vicinamibacterales bacterium]
MTRLSIMRSGGIVVLGMALLGTATTAAAQAPRTPQATAPDEDEHSIVFELGAAGDWSRAEGFHPGGTVAFEVTPIENWLEVEVGVTAIRSDSSTEVPVDVLFKKPWQFSRAFEFMAGVGPELVHATGPDHATFWGVEGVLDFMFWPQKNVGWYVEPGYELTRRDGARHQGLGIAIGLLLGR